MQMTIKSQLKALCMSTFPQESAPSRVIVVAGSAHYRGNINKEDLNFTKKYDAPAAYAQSKLANVLFVRELGRKMLGMLSL